MIIRMRLTVILYRVYLVEKNITHSLSHRSQKSVFRSEFLRKKKQISVLMQIWKLTRIALFNIYKQQEYLNKKYRLPVKVF